MLIPFLLVFFIIVLYTVRAFADTEIDDISPEILCENDYVMKSDVLWVVPMFNNRSIAEDLAWCESIISLNKTIGMHGIYHTYHELAIERDSEYFTRGKRAFEDCFGYPPKVFKPSHLVISSENAHLVNSQDMRVVAKFHQLTHRVYHCQDTGRFSNRFIDLY